MLLSVLFLGLGFVVLIFGADKLVAAASALAANFGIPNIVIGLTVVAFGTSAPELVVNVFAAINKSPEMVMGNVLGSNTFNILAILGISAVICPLAVKSNTTWIEIPLAFLAALLVLVVASDEVLDQLPQGLITRSEGIVMLLFFAVFLAYNIVVSKNPGQKPEAIEIPEYSRAQSVLWIIVGLAGLVLGGKLIVDNAVYIASGLGIPERVIGLTIVSIGTSLPELATSIAAVRKKKVDIAIGNVVGSNIFNIFFILGISSTILPINIQSDNFRDILMNIIASLLLFAFIFTGKDRKLERWEGIVFLALYAAYVTSLVIDAF